MRDGRPLPTKTATAVTLIVGTSLALLLSGVGVGVASGVALGVAGGLYDGLPNQPTLDAANAAYGENHVFGYSGFGLGAVALGLGATAVIVGKW